ncbi:ADP-ribosylglycohydrolase family protein [Mesorhizobium denitrificans]|uniref:ADP-ribosylglycohydrolase family protein n=2 Tax=Phyllobacteriaceae TaxID=69277 RepID=A0A371XKB7_9HYPH|nr:MULTISPECIES: ADP-ribosylglycohydrolase family protein [Mesorhizobium]RFC69662.1 ADP-ribosylglycohydrolase family protein [Mesorhizobium denitrificans]
MIPRHLLIDRAKGALLGGAVGDALGMPTQLFSVEEIRRAYGYVDGFVAPTPDHSVSKGLAAGTITDDTEQALLLAEVLVGSNGSFDQQRWVAALVRWESDVKARGGYDLLGPSTKRAIDSINAGVDPILAGREGDTNGAAMRIGPVGIAVPLHPLSRLVAKVAEASAATHGAPVAIATASAVAAAISSGMEGRSWREAIEIGIDAASLAQGPSPAVDVAAIIVDALSLVREKDEASAISCIASTIGTGVESTQSIPAAFAVLEVAKAQPWRAAVISANIGGDTDTIGAIATGMAGACSGIAGLPADRIKELRGIDLNKVDRIAEALVDLRLASEAT